MKIALLAWTLYWCGIMGVPAPTVLFHPLKGRQAETRLELMMGRRGMEATPTVAYDLRTARDARSLARHETCHLRMQHHVLNLDDATMEREALRCETWYKRGPRR